jgi:hypothetical protein
MPHGPILVQCDVQRAIDEFDRRASVLIDHVQVEAGRTDARFPQIERHAARPIVEQTVGGGYLEIPCRAVGALRLETAHPARPTVHHADAHVLPNRRRLGEVEAVEPALCGGREAHHVERVAVRTGGGAHPHGVRRLRIAPRHPQEAGLAIRNREAQ